MLFISKLSRVKETGIVNRPTKHKAMQVETRLFRRFNPGGSKGQNLLSKNITGLHLALNCIQALLEQIL
jgi:hypothetical protein